MKLSDKPLLLMLPGLLCDERLFTHQIIALGKNYHCVIPDFSPFDTIDKMAESVLKQTKSQQFYLLGFSMGGYIALELLNRAAPQILKLALINSSALEDQKENHKKRRRLIAQVSGRGTFKGITKQLIKRLISSHALEDPSIYDHLQKMTCSFGRETYIRHQNAILNRINQVDALKKVTCPTLLVTSEMDQIISPQDTKNMAQEIPHAILKMIKNAGHMTPIEAPKALTEILAHFFRTDK